MNRYRTLELISAAADGELGDAERAELDRLLDESPEAREFQAELENLEALFGDIPLPDMPETLHADIMARVPLPQAISASPMFAWLRAPAPIWRYGLATAAGLLLAVAFYESPLFFSHTGNTIDLVGTMAPAGSRSDTDLVDSYAFRSDGLETLIRLERGHDSLLLDIRIDADEPVELAVNLAGAGARLEALSQSESPPESISLADRILHIQALGRRRITAHLRRVDDADFAGEAKIELELSSEGKLLQQGSLETTW
ncbi:MAG: hypothetical protein WD795_21335 [Woeseia sp.]